MFSYQEINKYLDLIKALIEKEKEKKCIHTLKEFTIYSNVDVVGTLKNKTGIFNSHHEEQTVSLSHTPKVSLVALSRCYLQNTPLPYL